jgi:hypothetical protein
MLKWLSACAAALVATVATVASAQAPPADVASQIQSLSAELQASRSATTTLERWCGERHLAEPPTVVADVVKGAASVPTDAQLRRLDVTDRREIAYRKVQLRCGDHVLSEADNWYVPARLTPEMNRLLQTTETPFGKVVSSLEPYRRTFDVKVVWPDALFEHDAIVYTREQKPFSEVHEIYQRPLLKPDFTGDWVLDRQASTLSPGADGVRSGVVRIEHREPTFRHKTAFVTGADPIAFEFELTSDGRDVRGSSLRWDGNALVFASRIQRPGGEMRISFRYELLDGGRRLREVEQVRGSGRDQDNVWMFNRR